MLKRNRMMFSIVHWTPVRREVFEDVFPYLKSPLSQVLYLMLYDRVWHNRRGFVSASIPELAKWTAADWRTVKKALYELVHKDFVVCPSTGRAKSRSHKPKFEVPLAEFDIRTEGPWTAIPRFLIKEYPRQYRNSILASILLWHQDFTGGRNYCWPGVERLSKYTRWSERKVRNTLHIMGYESVWKKLNLDLPWPLEISYNATRTVRHYHLRAVSYEAKQPNRWPRMWLTEEFAKHFCISHRHENTKPDVDSEAD